MALFSSGVLLANVAADDTFDTWRVRTNQILTQAAGLTSNNVFSGTLNTFNNAVSIDGPVTAPIVTANTFAGTMATAAQPNITSVGTLTTLSVTGTAGFNGHITAPKVTANTFVGDGSGLTGLSAGLDWSTTTSTAPHYMLISSNTSGTNVDQFNVVSGITIHPGSGRITANTFIGDGSGLTGISAGLTIQDNTSTDASYYPILVSNTSGSGVDQIDVSSTKLYFNPSTGTMNATAFNSLSDETLKKNITKISNATDIVKQLEGIEFDWIDTNQKSSGVIAQSIEKVLPHVVESSDNNLKTVNYSGIISYLIEAVKELSERVSNLENK
jgi:hypothetical protein